MFRRFPFFQRLLSWTKPYGPVPREDPFYYWYQYVSAGTETGSNFQAYAYGNLDCDSVYSTFERSGTVLADRSVSGGAGMFSNNDTE